MITEIKFGSGASPKALPAELVLTPVTVFVGPNNSGKSRILVELEGIARGEEVGEPVVMASVVFNLVSKEDVLAEISDYKVVGDNRNTKERVMLTGLNYDAFAQIDIEGTIKAASEPNSTRSSEYALLRRYSVLRLDGATRLNLINEMKSGDLSNDRPSNMLDKILRNNALRQRIRDIIHDAVGKFFVIDPTNLGNLRVRFSSRAPISEQEERGITEEAVLFHKAGELVHQVSDGIRAFAGIITALLAGSPKMMLIDEPEAFLHPALAMKLGKEIGLAMNDPKKRLFVATHSSSFVMGCVQSRAPINIVRLTYKGGTATTRILQSDKLLHLMRNPMLRSTGVLDGLFYEAVIVTEADSDRAFYQEINERLRSANDPRGIINCLFLNAQNKQTVWDIVKPLRELGIPAVGIVDLDMVKDGGADFTRIMDSTFFPPMQHQAMSSTRENLRRALDSKALASGQTGDLTKNWWKRNGGISLLDAPDQQAANNYFSQLEDYGAFVVRNGELEVWLKYLKVPANKKRWLPDIFIAMGEDPIAHNYITPSAGDVWDFMGRIKNWVDNPNRQGIPA